MFDQVIPFRIDVPETELDDLRDRLRRTRWPDRETVADSGTRVAESISGINWIGSQIHSARVADGSDDPGSRWVDGAAGMSPTNSNLPEQDAAWWANYRDRVENAARAAAAV